ncbi:hypothetical protein LCGC14_2807760 [marine sediment metagenome]|uniref:Uncharacterized protein n=1 Tax=marine sediment metagenome TaxID=412755 RepID=A0A0F8Z7M6_9ZZZZ
MSDFKTWFDKEYPLPEGYERGPIGRDFMNGCEKAYKAGKAELQAELAAAKKEIKLRSESEELFARGMFRLQKILAILEETIPLQYGIAIDAINITEQALGGNK